MDYKEAWKELKRWLIDAQDEGFPYTITQVLEKVQEAEDESRMTEEMAISEVLGLALRAMNAEGMTVFKSEEDAIKMLKEKYW